DGDVTVGFDPHRRAFEGAEAADLDVRGKTDAEVAAILASLSLFLSSRLVVRDLQRSIERLVVISRVIFLAGRGGKALLEGGDEVASAHLNRIEPGGVGKHVHGP